MDNIQLILQHHLYQTALVMIETCEVDRIYCKHDMVHFLDVSRIAYIINLELALGYSKEIIYAVGLLHDIGRYKEYQENIPHEIASASLAKEILEVTSFAQLDKEMIIKAIVDHRDIDIKDQNDLSGIIYRADKSSRACFTCKQVSTCKWSDQKKNLLLVY